MGSVTSLGLKMTTIGLRPGATEVKASSTKFHMKITEALQAEHMVFHNLFDHIEKRVPHLKNLHAVQALATVLDGVLHEHGVVEDELLMAPLEESLGHLGQLENFNEEHEEIDDALRKIKACRDLQKGKLLLLRTVQRSRQHFDKEERIIFPLIEKQLKAKTLTALAQRWAQQRQAPPK